MADSFPFQQQYDEMDCGAACLRMVARYHGQAYPMEQLKDWMQPGADGVSIDDITTVAEQIGLRTLTAQLSYDRLADDIPLPAIVWWQESHFVVVYAINAKKVTVADPAIGKIELPRAEFEESFVNDRIDATEVGTVILLETTPTFLAADTASDIEVVARPSGYRFIWQYLRDYKGLLWNLALGVVLWCVLTAIFPFLIRAVVDQGIDAQDFDFVLLVLGAWAVLFASQLSVEYVRSWIVLHLGSRINIRLLSDFLMRLLRMPLRFFDRRRTGDLLQRIYDNERVERLLTTDSLLTIFSAITLLVFALILFVFDVVIAVVFILFTVAYFGWVLLFQRRRKALDHRRHDRALDNYNQTLELIGGIADIKLANAEQRKRWAWENTEARLFNLGVQYTRVEQLQRLGTRFFNESKNILITVLAAKAVIDGLMSLGELVAIQYILGQLNAPTNQLIGFIWSLQDASVSLERMREVYESEEREDVVDKVAILPEQRDLILDDVYFRYGGAGSPAVLRGLDLLLPEGSTTAIVGSSGSGKTTLLKLLLNIYQPDRGSVRLGDIDLRNVRDHEWRARCGAVLQDGYLFSDTVARNVALGFERIDQARLIYACKTAHIQQFVEQLPLAYDTPIGPSGTGLSEGQRQRLLLARAVYKDPAYLFLDEATNALDAFTETVVLDKLEPFLRGRTAVIVSHRLPTVRRADQIVVLEDGEIVESGSHRQLMARQGTYYRMVNTQQNIDAV